MKIFKRISIILLSIFVGSYLTIAGWMYVIQDSMVFYPQPLSESRADEIDRRYSYVESFDLPAPDGENINGWIIDPINKNASSVILYFCGNAEEASRMIEIMPRFQTWKVILANYRGYGLSSGKPSEQALFADSLLLYDKFAEDASRVVVFGRSLGTGVAVYVASKRKVDGVILVSPYDSLAAVGKSVYPFLPVDLLLRSKFDSYSLADSIKVPLLAFVGTNDKTVPMERSYNLLMKWAGPKQIEEVAGADHNTVRLGVRFWDTIQKFLNYIFLYGSVKH